MDQVEKARWLSDTVLTLAGVALVAVLLGWALYRIWIYIRFERKDK